MKLTKTNEIIVPDAVTSLHMGFRNNYLGVRFRSGSFRVWEVKSPHMPILRENLDMYERPDIEASFTQNHLYWVNETGSIMHRRVDGGGRANAVTIPNLDLQNIRSVGGLHVDRNVPVMVLWVNDRIILTDVDKPGLRIFNNIPVPDDKEPLRIYVNKDKTRLFVNYKDGEATLYLLRDQAHQELYHWEDCPVHRIWNEYLAILQPGKLDIYLMADGKKLAGWTYKQPLKTIAFLKHDLVVCGDTEGILYFWDIPSKQLVEHIPVSEAGIEAISAYHPNVHHCEGIAVASNHRIQMIKIEYDVFADSNHQELYQAAGILPKTTQELQRTLSGLTKKIKAAEKQLNQMQQQTRQKKEKAGDAIEDHVEQFKAAHEAKVIREEIERIQAAYENIDQMTISDEMKEHQRYALKTALWKLTKKLSDEQTETT